MVRVLLAESDLGQRRVLREALLASSKCTLAGVAVTGGDAVEQARRLHPDVVLIGGELLRSEGFSSITGIQRSASEAAVLALIDAPSDSFVAELVRRGASGVILGAVLPRQLVSLVRRAASGEAILSRQLLQSLADRMRPSVEPTQSAVGRESTDLNAGELQVLRLLAAGRSNQEMAQSLFVTESAIKARLSKMMGRFGVRDRVQLLLAALAFGVVAPDWDGAADEVQ